MIRVEMREDDVLDALGSDTRPAELRGHLVRTVELEPGEAEKGVPAREVPGLGRSGRLSGVEQTAAGRVIDEVRAEARRPPSRRSRIGAPSRRACFARTTPVVMRRIEIRSVASTQQMLRDGHRDRGDADEVVDRVEPHAGGSAFMPIRARRRR